MCIIEDASLASGKILVCVDGQKPGCQDSGYWKPRASAEDNEGGAVSMAV